MSKVKWTHTALDDLDAIKEHIARDSVSSSFISLLYIIIVRRREKKRICTNVTIHYTRLSMERRVVFDEKK